MEANAMHLISTYSPYRLGPSEVTRVSAPVLPPIHLHALQQDEFSSRSARNSLMQVIADPKLPGRRAFIKTALRTALNPNYRPGYLDKRSMSPAMEFKAITLAQNLRKLSPMDRLGMAEALLGTNPAFCQVVRGHMQYPNAKWTVQDFSDLMRPQPSMSPLGFSTLAILGVNMLLAPLVCAASAVQAISPALINIGAWLI